MISIEDTTVQYPASEAEPAAELLRAAKATYEHAVRSTAQYALEVSQPDAALFRQHLEVIRRQITTANDVESWKTLEASFRGELRDFRERSVEHLQQLRGEVEAAVATMRIFTEDITQSGNDDEIKMLGALRWLKAMADSEGRAPEELRSEFRGVASAIAGGLQVLRKSHQLEVAQMRDEVRLLHRQIALERKAVYLDHASNVWNRQKMDSLIFRRMEGDQTFILLLVCVRNLKSLDQQHSQRVISGALRALLQRCAAMLGENVELGRWNEDHFIAILEGDSLSALSLSREANARLTGSYSVQEAGLSQSVTLQVASGIVERTHAITASTLDHAIRHTTASLAGQ